MRQRNKIQLFQENNKKGNKKRETIQNLLYKSCRHKQRFATTTTTNSSSSSNNSSNSSNSNSNSNDARHRFCRIRRRSCRFRIRSIIAKHVHWCPFHHLCVHAMLGLKVFPRPAVGVLAVVAAMRIFQAPHRPTRVMHPRIVLCRFRRRPPILPLPHLCRHLIILRSA